MKNLGLLSFVKAGIYKGDLNDLKGIEGEYSLDPSCTNGPAGLELNYAHISVSVYMDQTWQTITKSGVKKLRRYVYTGVTTGYQWLIWENVS